MELSKNYIPAEVEQKWTKHWLAKDISTANQMVEKLLLS